MRIVDVLLAADGDLLPGVVVKENGTHADVHVFPNDQNGSVLYRDVKKVSQYESPTAYPVCCELLNAELEAIKERLEALEAK
jgi:hypothetical protein